MRTLLTVLACGALSLALAFPSSVLASPVDGPADSPPWVIANGQPGGALFMPREVQQACTNLVADAGWKEGAIDETTYFLACFFPRVTNHSDLAIESAGSGADGTSVRVLNRGDMAIPFNLVFEYADGSRDLHLTPAAWKADARHTAVPAPGRQTLKSVTLDTGLFPDANPGDNTWTGDAS
jgi:hypothetical protein